MSTICFFNSDTSWGGGVRYCVDTARSLKAKNHIVHAVCAEDSFLHKQYTTHGINTRTVRVGNASFLNPFKIFSLAQYFKKNKIEAVLCTTSQDLKISALAASMAGVPTICYRRGLDRPIKNRWLNRYLLTQVVTHMVANSEATKKSVLQHLGHILKSKDIKVIYNGIDTSQKPEIQKPHEDHIILGNAGRMVHQKGQSFLIDIAQQLRSMEISFEIRIAGDGPLYPYIQNAIKEQGLENQVKLLGKVEDMGAFLTGIDIFLLTSRWEGFGYVIAEAGWHQKPIIAWDISSNPELIDDEVTGFLCPVGDVDLFCERIMTLAQRPELRQSMGQKAADRVETRFNISKSVAALESFLDL